MSGDPAVFTALPPFSATVRSPWTCESLRNLLLHLSRLSRSRTLTVVAHAGYEPNALMELQRRERLPRIRVVSVQASQWPGMLAGEFDSDTEKPAVIPSSAAHGPRCHVIGHEKKPRSIVYVPLGAALLPDGAVDSLLEQLQERSLEFLTLAQLPRLATPYAYTREVAVRAARVWRDGAAMPADWQREWKAALTNAAKERTTRVTLAELLGADPGPAPMDVDLLTTHGAARFERICRELGVWRSHSAGREQWAHSAEAPGLLSAWRTREEREREHRPWRAFKRHRRAAKKAKVLAISQPVAYSGAEESLCQALAALPQDKYDLHALVGMDGLFADRLRALGANTRIADTTFSKPRPDTFRFLSRVFDEIEPDIVHFNACSGTAPLAIAKLAGSRCVTHLRVASLDEDMLAFLCESDHVIAVSEFVKARAVRAGVPAAKVSVVYDPLHPAQFEHVGERERAAAKVALGVPANVPLVLMVGRYERRKRHDLVLNAVASLGPGSPVHCVLVGESNGDTAYETELDRLIESRGLGSRVSRIGFRKDLNAVERAADVAVLCSDREPLGTFILESMAMGIPCIVSRDSGLAEVIGHDESGFTCANGDAKGLAGVLGSLIASESLRREVGRRGQLRCQDLCGPSSIAGLEAAWRDPCLVQVA